jgi:Condensation domain
MAGSERLAVPVRLVQEREVRQSIGGVAHQNLLYAWSLSSRLSEARMRAAVAAVVGRHEVLRTCFRTVDGEVIGVVHAGTELPWTSLELRHLAPSVRRRTLDEALVRLVAEAFPLACTPLARALFARVDDDMSVLGLAVAHIIWDAWSTALFAAELEALSCLDGDLPELPIQFWDFAAHERSRTPSTETRPRPAPPEYQPAEHRFQAATGQTAAALRRLARREAATPSNAVLAAFSAFLCASTGPRGRWIALLTANRDRRELRDLLGYLPRADALYVEPRPGLRFRELVCMTQRAVAATYADAERSEQAATHCDVLFNFVPATLGDAGRGRFIRLPTRVESVRFPARAAPWGVQIDLELFERGTGSIDAVLTYNTRSVDAATAHRSPAGFPRLLARLAAEPDHVPDVLMSARHPRGT